MGSPARPTRSFFVAGICLALLLFIPPAVSRSIRKQLFTRLEAPLRLSSFVAQYAQDLFYFRQNAQENRAYRQKATQGKLNQLQSHEISLENDRLTKLLDLGPSVTHGANRVLYARVVVRSPLSWNRTLWIDKGYEHGMRENLPVFSGEALVGKIIETTAAASKVILLTDPNCKIGGLLQRTRQQGILFGLVSGECRMKYISIDADVKAGDRVETAGLGIFFPKGIPVGDVIKVWKQPGQIYLVAQIKLLADPGKIEEVAVLDVR